MDRALGAALRQARDHQTYLHLGFVRLADYVAERLGMSLRSAQELIRVEEALAALPRTAAALESGEVTASHVRLLSRVATEETEPFWLARAKRMSVRAFRRAVASAMDRATAAHGPRGPGDGQPPEGGTDSSGTGPARQERPQPVPEELDEIDGEDERVPLAFRAPAWLLRWWRETVTLAGRVAGSPLPAAGALEIVLAEAADAGTAPLAPRPDRHGRSGTRRGGGSAGGPTASSRIDGPVVTGRTGDPAAARLGSSGRVAPGGSTSVQPPRDGGADPRATGSPPPDPRELDARLRELITDRQRCEASLAHRLACARAASSHITEGFHSLEAYASGRLGLPPRRTYYLLSLHRTLERLGDLRRAFLDGSLTLRQALLVGRVASRQTVTAWIRRARAVTLRRLEDEVEYWELLRVERPGVWEQLRGGPLPEDLVLVPGREPRLHASARESAMDAWAFLAALHESEARTPLPQRMGTLRMRVPPEVHQSWSEILERLRSRCDGPLQEWEALALILKRFWRVWDNTETRRQRREHATIERDGWRCTAPGCRAVGSGKLHEHHIIFRSAGGPLTDPANLTTQCSAHHQRLLHQGHIRCRGTAPDRLRWEMGVGTGQPAFLVYEGDRRVGGTAPPSRLQHHTLARVRPLRR